MVVIAARYHTLASAITLDTVNKVKALALFVVDSIDGRVTGDLGFKLEEHLHSLLNFL